MVRSLPLCTAVVMLCSAGCTSFQPVAAPSLIFSKEVEVRLEPPRDMEGRTRSGVSTRIPSARQLRGFVRAVVGDTLLLEVRSARAGRAPTDWLRLSPPVHVRVTIDGSTVRVADRRFSYFDTALGVVVSSPLIIALVLIVLCTVEQCFST